MSLLANQTNINTDRYFFVTVDSKVINTSTINANTGLYGTLDATNISTAYIHASTISTFNLVGYNNYLDYIKNINIVTNVITLDGQGLTASNGDLYINGVLVATPGGSSSIDKWANYPAIANINANFSTIKNVQAISTNNISSGFIRADTINAVGANITTLLGNQLFYNQGRILDLSGERVEYLSTLTDVLISKSITNEFEISSYSVNAQLGDFNVGNIQTLNTLSLSNAYNLSTAGLYANVGQINTLQTSNIIYDTLLGINISTNAITQNTSVILPTESSDGSITFQDNQNNVRGAILLTDNTSSFVIGTPNNLQLLGLSTTTLAGGNQITLQTETTIGTESIYFNTGIVNIDAGQFNTSALISTNIIQGQLANFDVGLFNNLITSNITASTITIDTLNTDNIINSSNIDTATLDVSGSASINNLTANGLTVNNSADYNTFISFGTSNSVFYGAQYLYDINSVRNFQAEKITVLGGWTGDDIIPPYYNDSIVEVGEDLTRPAQVTLNGFNPDPLDTGTVLTVRGDTQITQNLNVLGLTTLEGVVETIGDLNVDGALTVQGTTDLVGITTVTGFTNLLGGLEVTGETNFLGAVTAEAGIGVIGAVGVTLGDVVFGSAINTGNSFTNYGTTFLSNTNIGGTLSTNYIVVTSLPDTGDTGIVFADSNNVGKGVIQGTDNTLLIVGTENVDIGAISSITIQGCNNATFGGLDATIGGISTLFLFTQSTIRIQAESAVFDIQGGITTQGISSIITRTGLAYVDTLVPNFVSSQNIYTDAIYTRILGQPNGFVPTSILVNNGLDLQGNNISNINTLTASNISTGSLFIGEVSTLQFNASSINAGSANINNLTGAGNITNTTSLYPTNATSQLGFFGALGTTSGGWYNTLNARSTNTQVISPDVAGAFSNTLTLRGFVSSQSINSSTITSSNIFTSSIIATAINTNTGGGNVNFQSAFDYVSTGNVRCAVLQGASGGGTVTTFSLQPINSAQSLANPSVPYNIASITNILNVSLSTGTIVGGSATIRSLSSLSVSTATITASTIRTGFLETTATRTLATNYLSTYTLKTDFIQGNTTTGGSILFAGNPYPNVTNTGAIGTETFRWNSLTVNNTSTQSLVVSSINFKQYPYTSTLNIFPSGVSTYSLSGVSATTPQILISNVTFPTLGNYLVTSKMTLTKASGGSGQEGYPSLCLSRGLFPSTFATQDGFNALPYINHLNLSTFNTYTTSISITDNAQRSRFLTYYDQSGHTYTSRMAIADFRIRYLPGTGNLPDTGIS